MVKNTIAKNLDALTKVGEFDGTEIYYPTAATYLKQAVTVGGDNFKIEKAFTWGSSNLGSEFHPTMLSSQYIGLVREQLWHRQVIPSFMCPSTPYSIAKFTADPVFYNFSSGESAVGTNITAGEFATSSLSFSLGCLAARLPYTRKSIAYSPVNIEAALQAEFMAAAMECEEKVIIMGDEAGSSNVNGTDYNTGQSKAAYDLKAFDGIYKIARTASKHWDAGAATPDLSLFASLKRRLGRYGKPFNEMYFLFNYEICEYVDQFEELLTIEKYGAQAVIVSGEIGSLYGGHCLVTDKISALFASTGIYDGSSTTTIVIAFNRRCLGLGVPIYPDRQFSIEKDIYSLVSENKNQLIAVWDLDIEPLYAGNGISVAYNVDY